MLHKVEHQGERVLLGTVYPHERHDVSMREEVVCMCLLPEPLCRVSIVSVYVVSAFVVTHHANLIAIKADVTPIGFDGHLSAL